VKYLVAGLGNIGDEYINTRHNIGFKITEALAEEAGASFVLERLAHHCTYKWKGKAIHLIKPTTYMNLSGKAVLYWMNELKIPKENILIVVDDIALPFGTLRIKGKGSAGGHNGLKDIQTALATDEYPRLRFGVEGNFPKGRQVEYVLGQWTNDEQKFLPEKIKNACEATKGFITIGLERAMNTYNTK
jgi:PTH1 family peptidyl-tRNA hydrolase